MKKQELQSLVQECITEVLEERKKKSKGDDEFKRVDKGEKGKVAKDKGEEEVYGAGYKAGEKAVKSKYKKLAEAFKALKEYELKKPNNIYSSGGNDGNDKSSLKGKTINLIRTSYGTGKYNPEKGEMDKIRKEEDIKGEIGEIDNYEGEMEGTPGFWLMNPSNNKKMEYVMWDEKNKEFINGDSIFHSTYKGKSPSDQAMLDKFKP